jgi:Fe-S cluster assembly protein SufD
LASTTLATSEPDWLIERRKRGDALAKSLELPTQKSQGWEFTPIENIDFEAYGRPADGDSSAAESGHELFATDGENLRLDQVDLHPVSFAEPPSEPEAMVLPLDEAVKRFPELVRAHFGRIVSEHDPFVARNEAGWSGGAFVYVPRGASLSVPAVVTVTQQTAATALNWRTLIVLEDEAQAEVWEQYVSSAPDLDALFNTVVEVSVGQNANLRYICGQGLSEKSWIFGTQRAQVERDGSLEWIALGFGSGRGKVRMETKLAGQGAQARVTGGYAGDRRQHLDYDTTQEHAAPNTTSDLAFRGLLDGRATSVWRGMIHVADGAQKTDAFQESRNLLLSKRAHADAIPGLEIEADDVRCTHAATVAQIDKEQLFYLQSHGLGLPDAKRLVIEGFMQALVERLGEGVLRDSVASALEKRLVSILDS